MEHFTTRGDKIMTDSLFRFTNMYDGTIQWIWKRVSWNNGISQYVSS